MITRGGRLVVLTLALLGLAGCGPARGQQAAPAAASTQVIEVHGVRRTFHVYRPPGLAGPAPLVVMLHGGFGTGTQAEQDYVAGVVTTSVARCPGGRAVELITIRGAGHQWPGSVPPSRLAARLLHLDQPSTALNATRVIWRFFAAHPR